MNKFHQMNQGDPGHFPTQAPLWRKLLAVRVLLVSTVPFFVSFGLMVGIEAAKPNVPSWLGTAVVLLACLPFFMFIPLVIQSLGDLVVHFVPEGKVKGLLIGKQKSSQELAKDFAASAYWLALLPCIIWAAVAAVLIVILVSFGGVAIVSAIFSGWPDWAVVIMILLVVLLLKR